MKTSLRLATDFLTYIRTRNNFHREMAPHDWFRFAVKSSGGPGNPKGTTLAINQRAAEELFLAMEKTMAGIFEAPPLSYSSYDQAFTDLLGSMERLVRKHFPRNEIHLRARSEDREYLSEIRLHISSLV